MKEPFLIILKQKVQDLAKQNRLCQVIKHSSFLPNPLVFFLLFISYPYSDLDLILGSQKSAKSTRFTLSDIDLEDTPVKTENPLADTFKPRIPNLRSKTSAKKQKNNEVNDVEDPVIRFNEALTHCNQVCLF